MPRPSRYATCPVETGAAPSKRFSENWLTLERLLIEQLDHNLLFRRLVGLGIDDPVWHPTAFTSNRDRLLEGEVAARFLAAVLNGAQTLRIRVVHKPVELGEVGSKGASSHQVDLFLAAE